MVAQIAGEGGDSTSRDCPNCHSKKNWKDGMREVTGGSVQRYQCCDCGFRFSGKSNIGTAQSNERQICASEQVKNLDSVAEIKTVAGEVRRLSPELANKIAQFSNYLQNKGRSPETLRTYIDALTTLANKGADLLDPLSVETIIAKQQKWSLRAKRNYVDWYAAFCKRILHLDWEKPIYKAPHKIPPLPYESDIDQFIAGSPKFVSIATQIGKEIAARIGEVVKIEWIDIDERNLTLTINHPEKGSNTKTYRVTENLMRRIMALPKKTNRIFGNATVDSIGNMHLQARKRLAEKLDNPRIRAMHFHILRHWKLTDVALQTMSPWAVQDFGRHHDVKITMDYINLAKAIAGQSDKGEWDIQPVKDLKTAIDLGKIGYTPYMVFDGVQLVRKPK